MKMTQFPVGCVKWRKSNVYSQKSKLFDGEVWKESYYFVSRGFRAICLCRQSFTDMKMLLYCVLDVTCLIVSSLYTLSKILTVVNKRLKTINLCKLIVYFSVESKSTRLLLFWVHFTFEVVLLSHESDKYKLKLMLHSANTWIWRKCTHANLCPPQRCVQLVYICNLCEKAERVWIWKTFYAWLKWKSWFIGKSQRWQIEVEKDLVNK